MVYQLQCTANILIWQYICTLGFKYIFKLVEILSSGMEKPCTAAGQYENSSLVQLEVHQQIQMLLLAIIGYYCDPMIANHGGLMRPLLQFVLIGNCLQLTF